MTVAYDLITGGDIATFLATVQDFATRMRAAGTHMRALALSSAASPLADEFPFAPTDSESTMAASSALAESFSAPTEAVSALATVGAGMNDSFSEPTDESAGEVYQLILDHTGAAITDDQGAPILAVIGPLFT